MSIREDWESFWKAVAPPDAPEVQFVECKRAFYAGAWAMLQTTIALGLPEVSEEQGVAALEEIDKELRAFQQAVATGKA